MRDRSPAGSRNSPRCPEYRLPLPDARADVFNTLWQYSENLRQLYETPSIAEAGSVDAAGATALLQSIRAQNRDLLTEAESKQILTAYGIPTVETHIAADPDSAVAFAERMGYPVVLKLHSETVTPQNRCRRGTAKPQGCRRGPCRVRTVSARV
jgi:acyl-CoA synthetase (NDP forming)